MTLQEEGERTSSSKNNKLLSILMKKGWSMYETVFLDILNKTSNKHCAQVIQGKKIHDVNSPLHLKIKKKWWPEENILIESFLKRKHGKKLLVEKLRELILKDKRQMVVICESASKCSGFGGVGKTLTAKWYAHTYEREYDHIIWINCEEGSVLTSFQKLAMDLEIPNRNEMGDAKDYARKTYDAMSEFKCLWIYDNVKSYKGEGGIINILPKCKNFHCVLTSRSREWGTKKTGFGKISDLEVGLFSENESLNFLKQFLNDDIDRKENLLKTLCRSLGNHPLALQLSVVALNSSKIDLKTYLKNEFEKVTTATFEDYELTIKKNVKIVLGLILQEDNGKSALEVLQLFAYIRPDDVDVEFFMKVLNFNDNVMKDVLEILKNYSVVTISNQEDINGDQIKTSLSIHRLLQEVIRQEERTTEKDTLRIILGCDGFNEYKLFPFTKYATNEIKNEFPKVKADLFNQKRLTNLIREGKWKESVRLSKLIYEEFKTETAKFNYAICLAKNEDFEKSVAILEELEKKVTKETRDCVHDAAEMGLMKLKEELWSDLIVGHLLLIYWQMLPTRKLKEILNTRHKFQIIHSKMSLDSLLQIVYSGLIKKNYCLKREIHESTIKLELEEASSKIVLRNCSLEEELFEKLQFSPIELVLWSVTFTKNGKELKEVTVNKYLDLGKIKRLKLGGYHDKNISIDMNGDYCMDYVYLGHMKVKNWKKAKWNVRRMVLWRTPFLEQTKMSIREIKFRDSLLNVSHLPQTIEKLHLCGTAKLNVCNESIDFPNLKYLTLQELSGDSDSIFSSFQSIKISHIHYKRMAQVNVDQMPKSVTQVKITKDGNTTISGGTKKVDKLILQYYSSEQVDEFLVHFQTDLLVVYLSDAATPRQLINLTKKKIKRIAVGRIVWNEEDFTKYDKVDRKATCYMWEGGMGTGIEWEEFEKLML